MSPHVPKCLAVISLVVALGCGATGTVPPDQLTPTADAGTPLSPPPSRCTATADRVDCEHQTFILDAAGQKRDVHWQVPNGVAPAAGWPAAIFFQGSFYSAEKTWAAKTTDPYGSLYQTLTVKKLLDLGFAVLSPETKDDGASYWDTNVIGWSGNWDNAPDNKVMVALLDHLAQGEFGPIDSGRLYATGISSGGYMTSRMALSYPGKFRALAIVSASWATCGGSFCAMPTAMPVDHPPTLFMHGKADAIVPYKTMTDYEAQLRAEGHETKIVASETAGHEWLPEAPDTVSDWFVTHP